MMRAVLTAAEVRDETTTYRVEPGVIVATLVPLTNSTAAPGLETYDPARWDRRRLRDVERLPARELVTTFGHGSHTCPAQPFSLAAMATVLTHIAEQYVVEPRFSSAEPLRGQIGGVARSAEPCLVAYRRRWR
jgi:cytochrome P450